MEKPANIKVSMKIFSCSVNVKNRENIVHGCGPFNINCRTFVIEFGFITSKL